MSKLSTFVVTAITPLTTLPVVAENIKASSQFHVRVTDIPNTPLVLNAGANRLRECKGFIQIDIFRAFGTGADETLIDSIIAAIPFGAYSADGIQFEVVDVYKLPSIIKAIDAQTASFKQSCRLDYKFFA